MKVGVPEHKPEAEISLSNNELKKFPEVDDVLPALSTISAVSPSLTTAPANTELQGQLAFTTSSTKKRKLTAHDPKIHEVEISPDIPLNSVEARGSHSPSDPPRFDVPAIEEASFDSALPSHLPPRLQTSAAGNDYSSSAASSPSGAYAGLSISDHGVDTTGPHVRRGSLAPLDQETRAQSPRRLFGHRSIMGGAGDNPQRSASPLKRRASDLEAEVESSQTKDVDMASTSPSSAQDGKTTFIQAPRSRRALSVDMVREESEPGESSEAGVKTANGALDEIPSIDTQIKTVTTLVQAFLERQSEEGEEAYLVSKTWLNRVMSRGTEARQNSKVQPEGDVGPVDNSDIIKQIIKDCDGNDFVQLRPGVGSESFQYFSKDAWDLVMEWYGLMPGSIPIIRTAHNTNPDKHGIPNVVYELHPPIFTVHRLWSELSDITIPQSLKVAKPPAPIFVLSRTVKYHDFLKRAKEKANIDLKRKVRVWRVPRALPAAEAVMHNVNAATPPSSRPNSPGIGDTFGLTNRQPQDSWTSLFLDVPTFVKLRKGDGRELVEFKDTTHDRNYNGSMDLSLVGLGDTQTIVLDEHILGEDYVSNYVSRGAKSTSSVYVRPAVSNLSTQPTSQANSGRNSPAPSGPVTRGRAQKSGRTLGTVGLSNLGNTCYMNSALQCVRSVEELTKYFLTGAAERELNPENPLGNNGDVAVSYQRLLEEIYKDPVPTSVSPRYFKTIIGKYAPSFSGYGQQDSQEFLGFLLDGLQEDLSRVKKKPYIEKPDSTDEMVNNPEAIREMAAKVWDITKKRDDSVIADLFTGMYKSTLVCPICHKVSITFDPFNNLTLQLPIDSAWTHSIFYFPLNDKPIIIPIDMDKHGSILTMKEHIGKKVGVPAERLFAAEEFKSKFYKVYDNYRQASEEIAANDNVCVYELEAKPTNWPAPKKAPKPKAKYLTSFGNNDSDSDEIPNWDDPLAERLLVPVFHRRQNPERSTNRFRKPHTMVPVPHFIIVTPEEARSEDMIKRKILEKVATLTTHADFVLDDEASASASESVDPDMVITSGSDADSSGGSKVVATSIDSEDELVDVTMKDANGARETNEQNTTTSKSELNSNVKPMKSFNKRRPKFIDPKEMINPAMQNMFDLCYVVGTKELVPTGWTTLDDDKTYPSLASRNPQLQQSPGEESGNDYDMSNGRRKSESSNSDDNFRSTHFSGVTRMTDELESDEDELASAPNVQRNLPLRPVARKPGSRVGNKGRKQRIKTYSKKERGAARKQNDHSNSDQDAPDEGPLIRLGEGIVVEWTTPAYETLFCGEGPEDTLRGQETFTAMPKFEDPELAAKRAARQQRRKNGITLADCLNEFGKEEILSEMDTWYCPRCKEHRRASKKFELWKTPDILIMHLKRFSSSSNRRDKLDIFVDFPVEGLDLGSRVIEKDDGKSEVYDLFAVDDHWGGLGGGHYTAFAKNFVDGEWYEYNDSSVSKQKDASRVVSQSAYLLFYRRRSDEPLGGDRFKQIFHDFDHPPSPPADEESESGEDQRLVANSSLHGSSSALIGAAAARHQPSHGSIGAETMTVNPRAVENPPSYRAHEMNGDAAQINSFDADVNEGLTLADSIEDEGIEMDMESGYNTLSMTNVGRFNSTSNHPHPILGAWSFDGLESDAIGQNRRGEHMISGTGSNASDLGLGNDHASDVVQHNSSASDASLLTRQAEYELAMAEDDDNTAYEDPDPVPDMDEDDLERAMLSGALRVQRTHRQDEPFEVSAGRRIDADEDEEEAAEIHVEEGEGLKG